MDLPDFSPEGLRHHAIERAETILSSGYTDPRILDFESDAAFARSRQ